MAGRTTVEWHHVRNDEISASVQIDGDFRPTAVAQDGKLVALIDSAGTTTTVVLATPGEGEVRRWTFDAVLVPEAFANAFETGSDLPIGVFVIEYLAANTYRVRVIDTKTGSSGPTAEPARQEPDRRRDHDRSQPHRGVRTEQPAAVHAVSGRHRRR